MQLLGTERSLAVRGNRRRGRQRRGVHLPSRGQRGRRPMRGRQHTRRCWTGLLLLPLLLMLELPRKVRLNFYMD